MSRTIPALAIVFVLTFATFAEAQRRPVQIGGPNGLVMGGGMGFMLGGRNGVHFGGGQGARFGPPQFGMHFGGGQGARFGGQNFGMHFGGGRGAHFGGSNIGMQFGGGQGAQIGRINPPVYGQGTVVYPQNYSSQIYPQQTYYVPQTIMGSNQPAGNPVIYPPSSTVVQPQSGQIIPSNMPSTIVSQPPAVSGGTVQAPTIEPIQNNTTQPKSILERTSDK